FARIFGPIERLDHLDKHHVVINGLTQSTGNAAPHFGIERLTAATAALAERREIGPVPRRLPFSYRADRGNHDNERAEIHRVLDFAFIGISHAHAGYGFRMRTRLPPTAAGFAVSRIALPVRPDAVMRRL